MLTAIPRASRSPPPRWPPSPSNVTRSMASGTTPSHPTSSRHEAVLPRQILKRSTTPKAGPLNQRATAYFGSPSYGPAYAIGGPQFFPFVMVEGMASITDVQDQS